LLARSVQREASIRRWMNIHILLILASQRY
jgi:hypothetical protein